MLNSKKSAAATVATNPKTQDEQVIPLQTWTKGTVVPTLGHATTDWDGRFAIVTDITPKGITCLTFYNGGLTSKLTRAEWSMREFYDYSVTWSANYWMNNGYISNRCPSVKPISTSKRKPARDEAAKARDLFLQNAIKNGQEFPTTLSLLMHAMWLGQSVELKPVNIKITMTKSHANKVLNLTDLEQISEMHEDGWAVVNAELVSE